ncbi:hypothetical protein DFQ28_008105 [Apophysomyces sp. BC1034]|nr:hypothetical protein DFQ28_008105 [Apophysomyces sp. BC1034]
MGGVTVAQQPASDDGSLIAYSAEHIIDPDDPSWPVEDLTQEVQDLMMRESMTWLDDDSVELEPPPIQLEDLFGQDEFYQEPLGPYYDEISFDGPMKRRRSSSCSDSSVSSASDNEELDMTLTHRQNYSSDESDVEQSESPYLFMHRRQIEETLMNKITQEMDASKLPGILVILSENAIQTDEVEIDLSCLAHEQLVRILAYVEACIAEQNGGPVVDLETYIVKDRSRKVQIRPARVVQDDSEDTQEPISMATLSKRPQTKQKQTRRKRAKNKEDGPVHPSTPVVVLHDPESIASSKPKRRAALHKRRLLEDMLQPSDEADDDDDDDGDDNDAMVVLGDEQMDLGIIGNQTILHQSATSTVSPLATPVTVDQDDDENEEIDIML